MTPRASVSRIGRPCGSRGPGYGRHLLSWMLGASLRPWGPGTRRIGRWCRERGRARSDLGDESAPALSQRHSQPVQGWTADEADRHCLLGRDEDSESTHGAARVNAEAGQPSALTRFVQSGVTGPRVSATWHKLKTAVNVLLFRRLLRVKVTLDGEWGLRMRQWLSLRPGHQRPESSNALS